jgi:hypothetical protein
MGMFSGNIGNSYQNNHVFIILDSHFQDHGVGSLTKNGFNEFAETDFGRQVLGNRSADNLFAALGIYAELGTYHKYNGSADAAIPYVSEPISALSLLNLIDYHESGQAQDPEQRVEVLDKQIKEIKNSLEGYVGFKKDGKLILKCYLNAVGKGRNDRVVTQKGSPLITATPRLPSGRKVSSRHSQSARQTLTDNFPGIGTYVDATKGEDDDVENVVTGPMRLSWNEVTGSWESANQQLARLITDLEPANIVGVELNDDSLNSTNSNEYYSKTSTQYMGQRSTGIAMPLSIQSNNPEMFGPNLIKCEGSNKVEQISVVNRSNDSFKNGDIILCSFIGGEWIAQKFGTTGLEAKPQPTSIGRWGFTKLIANSDWYFRDGAGTSILPASCQDLLRGKFYSSLNNAESLVNVSIFRKQEISTLNSIGALNTNRTLHYYIQSTSFDNSGPTKGGTAREDFYARINVEQPAYGDTITYYQTPIFWGPVFPDGYSSAGHARMRANSKSFKPWKHSGINTSASGRPLPSTETNFFSSDFTHVISEIPNLDPNDSDFFQLPADIATNGKYGGDGFPIEHSFDIMRCINSTDDGGQNSTFATSINTLINSNGFAYYLGEHDQPNDVYGLKPANPLKLQFSPLCAELAGSDDANSVNLTSRYAFDRNFKKNARDALKDVVRHDALAGEPIPYDISLFGNLYERLQSWRYTFTTITPVLCNGVYASALIGQFQGIPYDCYIQQIPLNKPKASTTVFSTPENPATDGANLVGIITARNAFTKNKGGTMNISLKQVFGMYGNFIGNGGGGSIAVTILGSIGAWSTDNTSVMKARYAPIWGSTISDSINSFGTTALHCMVWDYWPEQQTVFVPQYFTVLHFNAGTLFSQPRIKTGSFSPQSTGGTTTVGPPITINIDISDFDIDFRIPSYNIKGNDGGYVPVIAGDLIYSFSSLAPSSDWRVNTVRRGQLVTNQGFLYYKLVIGLDKDSGVIANGGTGFSNNSKIDAGKGVTIEVTTDNNGTITSFVFAQDTTFQGQIPATVELPRKQGEGFVPSDFQNQYSVTLRSPTTGGTSAIIKFARGKAYNQIKQDVGPKLRTPITRLSSSSGEGTVRVEETKNTTLNIEDNTGSKYPNKYEAFYFFHNDITHTFNMAEVDANPNFTQYMTMTIS